MSAKASTGLIAGYILAGVVGSFYYMSGADTDDSGTVTKAEYDAAVDEGNTIFTTVLRPGLMIGEEVLSLAGLIKDTEPEA